MALGALLQVLSVDTAVRALPRRIEELLRGTAVPEADTNSATQVLINFAKGLGVSTVDAGVSVYGLRPTSPGGTDKGVGITPFLNGTTDLIFPLSSRRCRWVPTKNSGLCAGLYRRRSYRTR
jgi:hypothetical protein